MTEQTNVIWTTTTKDGVRIQLTKNELTIDMAPDWVQTIDQRGRTVAEWFMNALLPHKIEIKDIRKVERDSRKIVIVSKKGFLKRCGIGLPKSELDQLETELNKLVQ